MGRNLGIIKKDSGGTREPQLFLSRVGTCGNHRLVGPGNGCRRKWHLR